MSRESLEELRERLLRDERAQQLIRMRAFEIYKLRGEHPGGEAHDWLQAESEVLTFLIEEESHSTSVSMAAAEPAEPASNAPSAGSGKPVVKRAAKQPSSKSKETKVEKAASKRTAKKAPDSAAKARGKGKKDS